MKKHEPTKLTLYLALTSKSLDALSFFCPNIEILNISSSNVDDSGVAKVAARCGGLTSITLNTCKNITDSALQVSFWCEILTFVQTSKTCGVNRHHLGLWGDLGRAHVKLGNAIHLLTHIQALAMHTRVLQQLYISHCPQLTGNGGCCHCFVCLLLLVLLMLMVVSYYVCREWVAIYRTEM